MSSSPESDGGDDLSPLGVDPASRALRGCCAGAAAREDLQEAAAAFGELVAGVGVEDVLDEESEEEPEGLGFESDFESDFGESFFVSDFDSELDSDFESDFESAFESAFESDFESAFVSDFESEPLLDEVSAAEPFDAEDPERLSVL
jgi:hypothetical protein